MWLGVKEQMVWLPMAGIRVPFNRRLFIKVAVLSLVASLGPAGVGSTLSRQEEHVGDVRGLMCSSHLDWGQGRGLLPVTLEPSLPCTCTGREQIGKGINSYEHCQCQG